MLNRRIDWTAFVEPFVDSALQLARFVAHVLLIAGMRLVIENVVGATGLGLAILDGAENVAIAVVAIRSFWTSRSVRGGRRTRAAKVQRPLRRAGFL